MHRVGAIKTMNGVLHWSTAPSDAIFGGDPNDSIVITINPMMGGYGKRTKPYLQEVMENNGEHWLWKDGDTWHMDLHAVRTRFPIFTKLTWMEGIAKFPLRATSTHRDPDPLKFVVYREEYLLEKSQKVFLSHKGADKELVREFDRVLTTLGYNTWLDEDAMPAGTPLDRGILQGFKDSCAAVFFITPNFRDEMYLATEIEYAIQQRREKGNRFQIIAIVLVGKKKQKGIVPQLLQGYVWKEPATHLLALNEILIALPIQPGALRWKAEN